MRCSLCWFRWFRWLTACAYTCLGILTVYLLTLALAPPRAFPQTTVEKVSGYCERGGQKVTTAGQTSTTTVQKSYPSCTVTVYRTGTSTLQTIYSNSSLGAKSNPFTSDTNGYWEFYVDVNQRLDVQLSGGTAPNNISTPFFWKSDFKASAGGIVISNQTVDLPARAEVNLELPFLKGVDVPALAATNLNTQYVPTGVYNALTDLNMSGDPRIYTISVTPQAGHTSVTITNPSVDTSVDSIFPRQFKANATNTWRVGQGIRIPNGVASGQDLIATVTAVSGETVTFTPAITYASGLTWVQHDDTAALQTFIGTTAKKGTIFFPEGKYPISSFHNYSAGKDYAITISQSSEALHQQWVLEGLGRDTSGFVHTGPGHAFKLAGTSTTNLEVRSLGITHENRLSAVTNDWTDAGAAFYLQSDQNSAGVPQSNATNVTIEDNLILGWRYGVLSDNIQSSTIRDNSIYYTAIPVAMIGTTNTRGIGSQTEPNANTIENNFIQYAPNLAGQRRSSTGSTTAASRTITCAGCSFTSADLYKIVRVAAASVNGTDHYSTITSVTSSSQVVLSQPPYLTVASTTVTLYPTSVALIYLQNANLVSIKGGTWQGNRSVNGVGADANGECHDILAENGYQLAIDDVWMENTSCTMQSLLPLTTSDSIPAGIRLNNMQGVRINGTLFRQQVESGTGSGVALILDNSSGVYVGNSYVGTSGNSTGFLQLNGSKGLKLENTAILSARGLANDFVPTDWGSGNFANSEPAELGAGVNFYGGSVADDYSRATEMLHDSRMETNLAVNGNFWQATAFAGWTQNTPSALTMVNGGNNRFDRYVKITPNIAGAGVATSMLSQSVSIPNAIPAAWNLSLAFNYYIEDRGVATDPASGVNALRVKLIWAGGSTYQYEVNPTTGFRTPSGRWLRAQIVTPIPSGTSRSVQILLEAFDGANRAIYRVTDFRLAYGKRPDFSNDEPITQIKGGTIAGSGTLTLEAGAGGGTRTVCVDNSGNLNVFGCGGGGGGSTALSGLTAATAANSINNGDHAQVWNWQLTTSGKTAFKFGESSASTAGGVPHLVSIETLSGSTANPLQVTANGNGVRLGTAGNLVAVGTGGVDAAALVTGTVAAARGGAGTVSGILKANGAGVVSAAVLGTDYGNVVGPASATDNAVVRFDLTTGKLIQNSVVTIADTTGDLAGVGSLTMAGQLTNTANTNAAFGIALNNSSSGTAATNEIDFTNASASARVGLTSTGWTGGTYSANQTFIEAGGTNGLYLNDLGSSKFVFAFAGTENSRLNTTGLCLGCNAPNGRLRVFGLSDDELITGSGYNVTVAGATNALDFVGTWNTTGAPTLFKFNVTNTASAAGSQLLDLQVDTVSKFAVRKDGVITSGSADVSLLTSGTLGVARGGIGISSGTSGGIPYFSSSSTIASSAALTANLPVIGGGAGVAPSVGARTGNTTTFATATGALTSGRCAEWDVNGNLVQSSGACGVAGSGYTTIQEEGSNLTARATLNFVGSSATAADDTTRTNVTFDGALNSLASNTTNGLLAYTAADTLTARTIVAGSSSITITNGDGVSGNPSINTVQPITTLSTPSFSGLGLGGATAPTFGIASNGLQLSTEATGTAGAGSFLYEINSNDTAPKTWYGVLISGTLDAGVSNTSKTNYLIYGNVDVTAATGITTNLLHLRYGGTQQFNISSGGVANAATGFQIAGAAASGNFLRGNGTNFVSSAIQAADYPTMVGDSGSGGTKGAVPAPAAGDASKCLSGAATYVACSGGTGAPTSAQYVVLALDATLSAERVLTGTTNQVVLTDGGANGNITLSTPQDIATGSNVRFGNLGLNVAAPTSGGQISSTLGANTITGLLIKRNTDTAPAGNFEDFQNAAGTSLWTVDINGSLATGSVPVGRLTGLGTGVATWLATPSSANLISAVTDETGSGALVFGTSPTLTTPRIANAGYIADANGNEQIILTTTASAVNEITLANAATGSNPTITASGGDVNVGLNLVPKGTGTIQVSGSEIATAAKDLSFFAITTSSALAGKISDETGSGVLVFGTSPTLTTPTISGAITFPDGVRQTFNPDATNAGLNVGAQAGDPSTPSNGDLWYDLTANELTARINGANVALGAGGSTGANPTASVGLTAVNGVATTFMRSDAAPALSQAITPTWTGLHTFNVGTTPSDAIFIGATAIGSAGTRDSHNLVIRGASDDGTAHTIDWKVFNDVTSNAGASTFTVQSRKDAASFANRLTLTDEGSLTITGQFTTSATVAAAFGVGITNSSANAAATAETDWINNSGFSLRAGIRSSAATPASESFLESSGSTNGIYINSNDSGGRIRFAVNNSEIGRVDANGLRLVASTYLNFGSTSGSTGYGVRDNAGAIEAKDSGGSWLPIATTTGTQTFTGKTYDAEASGNSLTIPVKLWLPAAGCNNATAGPMWDLPTTGAAVAACVTGTNTQKGVLDYADASNLSAQQTLRLPSDWSGAVDVGIKWLSSTTTGDVVWQVATSCVADAETDDPAFNTASTVTDTTKGTANQTNDASITGLTMTGCAAGELLHVKVFRDSAHASDTMAGTARLIGLELTYRRAM